LIWYLLARQLNRAECNIQRGFLLSALQKLSSMVRCSVCFAHALPHPMHGSNRLRWFHWSIAAALGYSRPVKSFQTFKRMSALVHMLDVRLDRLYPIDPQAFHTSQFR